MTPPSQEPESFPWMLLPAHRAKGSMWRKHLYPELSWEPG